MARRGTMVHHELITGEDQVSIVQRMAETILRGSPIPRASAAFAFEPARCQVCGGETFACEHSVYARLLQWVRVLAELRRKAGQTEFVESE